MAARPKQIRLRAQFPHAARINCSDPRRLLRKQSVSDAEVSRQPAQAHQLHNFLTPARTPLRHRSATISKENNTLCGWRLAAGGWRLAAGGWRLAAKCKKS